MLPGLFRELSETISRFWRVLLVWIVWFSEQPISFPRRVKNEAVCQNRGQNNGYLKFFLNEKSWCPQNWKIRMNSSSNPTTRRLWRNGNVPEKALGKLRDFFHRCLIYMGFFVFLPKTRDLLNGTVKNTARGARFLPGSKIYIPDFDPNGPGIPNFGHSPKKWQVCLPVHPEKKTFGTEKKTRIETSMIVKKNVYNIIVAKRELTLRLVHQYWPPHHNVHIYRIENSAVFNFTLLCGNWEQYICAVFGWVVMRNHRNADICTGIVWMGMAERDLLGNGLDGNGNCDLSR